MKRLLINTGLLTVLACSLQAQTSHAVADIPFDFHMGRSVLHAGKYDVDSSRGVLTLRNHDGQCAAAGLTFPSSRQQIAENPKLTFNQYGSTYFLAAVWAENSHQGLVLPKSKDEQSLIRDHSLVQTASIGLH